MCFGIVAWVVVEFPPECMQLLWVVVYHIIQIVVATACLCRRVLFLVHVLVLRSYVGTWVAPIAGTAVVQEAAVVPQYTAALPVPYMPPVAEPFHMHLY